MSERLTDEQVAEGERLCVSADTSASVNRVIAEQRFAEWQYRHPWSAIFASLRADRERIAELESELAERIAVMDRDNRERVTYWTGRVAALEQQLAERTRERAKLVAANAELKSLALQATNTTCDMMREREAAIKRAEAAEAEVRSLLDGMVGP
jgi:uncharacterized coiled-coil protein SlyX